MPDTSEGYILLALFVVWGFSSRTYNLYDEFMSSNFSFEFSGILKAVFVQSLSSALLFFLLKVIYFPRSIIIIYTITLLVLLISERFIFRKILEKIRKRGTDIRQLLIIGAGDLGKDFSDSITNNVHFGYCVIGFLDDDPKPYLDGKYLGKIDELNNVLSSNCVDDVIIALPNYAENKFDGILRICENHTTRVKIIPDYSKFVTGKFEISMFGKYPIVSVRKEPINEIHWRVIKRAFDIFFSLAVIVTVLWWFGGIIALIIKITSKGPVLFKQERWGRNNKKFLTLKFRSMDYDSKDVDENGKFQQATKDDPRITTIGKYLRKANLDELPQFWNVFRGDMSVVGPRPHPELLNLESKVNIDRYMLRTLVKPGISGWAQVNGYRGETKDSELMQKRVDYDLWYIENWTFLMDIQIIFMTLFIMLKGDPRAM